MLPFWSDEALLDELCSISLIVEGAWLFKNLLVFALFSVLPVLWGTVSAQTKSVCAAGPLQPRFDVAVVHQPFRVREGQSQSRMIQLSGSASHLAFLEAIPQFEVELQWKEFEFWQRTCFVADLQIILSHQGDSMIYMSDRLTRESCSYKAVLAHQRRREAEHHELLVRAAQVLRLQYGERISHWKLEPSDSTQPHQVLLKEMADTFKRFYIENVRPDTSQPSDLTC